MMPLSDRLRAAIKNSGKSLNALSKECGIPQPTISRFMNGGEMRSANLDVLADFFGLDLLPITPTKSATKKSPKGK